MRRGPASRGSPAAGSGTSCRATPWRGPPGPIRGEYRGHVTRSPPMTAHPGQGGGAAAVGVVVLVRVERGDLAPAGVGEHVAVRGVARVARGEHPRHLRPQHRHRQLEPEGRGVDPGVWVHRPVLGLYEDFIFFQWVQRLSLQFKVIKSWQPLEMSLHYPSSAL